MRQIVQIHQGIKDNTCGQACVAMAAGVTLKKAIAVVGTQGRTNGAALKRGLASLGIRTSRTRTVRKLEDLSQFCIAAVNFRVDVDGKWVLWKETKNQGHCVLIWDGVRYDPLPPGHEWPDRSEVISCFDILDTD